MLFIGSLFVPLWRIELDPPQYPEGLVLQLHANKIAGEVDIINGLNHYIGMATLHTENFFEFTILPYIFGALALFAFALIFYKQKKGGSNLLYHVRVVHYPFCNRLLQMELCNTDTI